jgi:hypothetical protein
MALTNFQAEAKPEIEKEGIKQEQVNKELTTENAKTEKLNQLNTKDNKTQPLEEAASTKEEAEGSSSVEPEWGRFARQMRRKWSKTTTHRKLSTWKDMQAREQHKLTVMDDAICAASLSPPPTSTLN